MPTLCRRRTTQLLGITFGTPGRYVNGLQPRYRLECSSHARPCCSVAASHAICYRHWYYASSLVTICLRLGRPTRAPSLRLPPRVSQVSSSYLMTDGLWDHYRSLKFLSPVLPGCEFAPQPIRVIRDLGTPNCPNCAVLYDPWYLAPSDSTATPLAHAIY